MKPAFTKRNTVAKLLGLSALAFYAAQAQADVIGNVAISPEIGALAKIDNAAQSVDFYCALAPCVDPNNSRITFANGIFASIYGELGTMRGFQIADENAADYLIGHTLWSSGNISLRIDSLDAIENQPDVVTGFGSATFFMDDAIIAMGDWSLSIDKTGVANFSSTAEAVSVPEPGTMVLLGIGLVGIGATRVRAMAQKA